MEGCPINSAAFGAKQIEILYHSTLVASARIILFLEMLKISPQKKFSQGKKICERKMKILLECSVF
jgi:hypothetical protein